MPKLDAQKEHWVDGKSANQHWAEFFDIERQLFDLMVKNINIPLLESVDGFLPEYKMSLNDKGKTVFHPPRTIRAIYHTSPNYLKTKVQPLISTMEAAYTAARMAIGDDESDLTRPARFPKVKKGIKLIKISSSEAHRSHKVDPKKNLVILKRRSKDYTGKEDQDVQQIWSELINNFSGFGIRAYASDDELSIDSQDLINYANGCDVQFRVATGKTYTAWLYNEDEEKEKVAYGFIICEGTPAIETCKPVINRKNQITAKATELPFDFLPKGFSMWAKTAKIKFNTKD